MQICRKCARLPISALSRPSELGGVVPQPALRLCVASQAFELVIEGVHGLCVLHALRKSVCTIDSFESSRQ